VGGCRVCIARRRVPQSIANTNTFATLLRFCAAGPLLKLQHEMCKNLQSFSMIMGPHPVRSAPPSQGLRRPLSLSLSLSLSLPLAYIQSASAAPLGSRAGPAGIGARTFFISPKLIPNDDSPCWASRYWSKDILYFAKINFK